MSFGGRCAAHRTRWLLATLTVSIATLVAGCDSGGDTSSQRSASVSDRPADPLDRLTDPGDDSFVSADPDVLLHEQATGPQRFTVKPGPGDSEVVVYVSCAPSSDYSAHMVGNAGTFFSGTCDREFQNFAGLPLAEKGGQVQLDLTVPEGVRSWVVALPSRK